MRRAAAEPPGELDERRTPSLGGVLYLWRGELVTTATLPVHCRSSCGRRLLSAPDQIEASWEPTHTGDMPDGLGEYCSDLFRWGGSDCTYVKSYVGARERRCELTW